MRYTLIKAEKAAFMFWKFVNRFCTLKSSLLLNLFDVLVTPIILYCAEIWFPFLSQKDNDKIEAFHRINLKRILGVPISSADAAIYLDLNTCSIETRVKVNILKFLTRLKKVEMNEKILINVYLGC